MAGHKNAKFPHFPFKSLTDQIWPWHKIGQGQPRIIIYINFVVLESQMLHTKFQGNWLSGSGEEDFLRFSTYICMAAILVMWPGPFDFYVILISHEGFIWNIILISLVVPKKKDLKKINLSDLWPRSLNDLDLQHLYGLKLTAFPYHKL